VIASFLLCLKWSSLPIAVICVLSGWMTGHSIRSFVPPGLRLAHTVALYVAGYLGSFCLSLLGNSVGTSCPSALSPPVVLGGHIGTPAVHIFPLPGMFPSLGNLSSFFFFQSGKRHGCPPRIPLFPLFLSDLSLKTVTTLFLLCAGPWSDIPSLPSAEKWVFYPF